MVTSGQDREKKLRKFKSASEEILNKMIAVILHAQQKIDANKYNNVLEKLKNYGE